ncbi:MAG: methyltransferase domain-containing protein [Chloroflexota bacterium]|nr:methyltransferase domain-containing protein [Chloroflexota bacterium]
MPVDPYHAIAALYDLEHDPFRDDIDLLLSFAEAMGGPILEMGCGSGRVLAPLAEAGSTVVGLDRSTTMLDRARTRLASTSFADRVSLVEGDMAGDVPLPSEPFGLVAFTLNALMHLPSPELQIAALADARNRLAPDGQLIIDIVNSTPDYLVSLTSSPALEWSSPLDDGSIVDKWAFRQIHSVEQIIETTLWYDQVKSGGELLRRRSQFDLRYLHPNELSLMLDAAGFADVHMYGSYELDPLDDSSDRILVTAKAMPTK